MCTLYIDRKIINVFNSKSFLFYLVYTHWIEGRVCSQINPQMKCETQTNTALSNWICFLLQLGMKWQVLPQYSQFLLRACYMLLTTQQCHDFFLAVCGLCHVKFVPASLSETCMFYISTSHSEWPVTLLLLLQYRGQSMLMLCKWNHMEYPAYLASRVLKVCRLCNNLIFTIGPSYVMMVPFPWIRKFWLILKPQTDIIITRLLTDFVIDKIPNHLSNQ